MKDTFLAFKAWSFSRKLISYIALAFIVLVAGFLSGILQTVFSGAFFRNAHVSIFTILRYGFLTFRGIFITILLLFLFSIFIVVFLRRQKARFHAKSTDEEGTTYSSTGGQGSMGWMTDDVAREEFEVGNIEELFGYLFGKLPSTGEAVTYREPQYGNGNKNVMILGQPGTGKSFSLIRNELVQSLRRLNSFVCTDPKGELFTDTATYCRNRCDIVWTINFLDPEHSNAWNFVRLVINPKTGRVDDTRLEKFASTYMSNAMPDTPDRSDFWYMGALNLFQAVIALCAYEHEEYIRKTLLEATQRILDTSGSTEKIPAVIAHDKKISLVRMEKIFRRIAKDYLTEEEIDRKIKEIKNTAPPFSISQVYYEVIRLQGETYDGIKKRLSVLPKSHSAVACFNFFNNPNVKNEVKASTAQGLGHRMLPLRDEYIRRMLSHDEVDILEINQKQCAVYLIVPDNSDRYKSITSVFFKFLVDELSYKWDVTAQKCKEKGLDTLQYLRPVSIVMDEFANIGKIPEFERFMSTGRGRKLNITIAVQHVGQLHDVYGDNAANTIKNDCDTVLFLGTNDDATAEWMSTFILGVTTTIKQTYSRTEGRLITSGVEGITETEQQRYLMYISEIRKFSGAIICAMHGKDPLKLDLFGYIEHPEAKWFQMKSLESSFEKTSERFEEIDPLLIMDLKEVEEYAQTAEKIAAEREGRAVVLPHLVEDKTEKMAENRKQILDEVEFLVYCRMNGCDEDGVIELDELEEEDVLDLDDFTEAPEPKEEIVDSTYREIARPKKPKKNKNNRNKKTGKVNPVRPADVSELND